MQQLKLDLINKQRQADFREQEIKHQANEIHNLKVDLEKAENDHRMEIQKTEHENNQRITELKKVYTQMKENTKAFDKSNPDQAAAMLEFEYQEQIRNLEKKLKTV